MDLEKITNLLVDNAARFRTHNTLDMSMFPASDVPRIYEAAAEGTLRKKDYESTGQYLYLAKSWDRLLELAVPLFHSEDQTERTAGKSFLEILMYHATLPKPIAVELAGYIIENELSHSRYRAAQALKAGKAHAEAEKIAYQFLDEGDFETAKKFLDVSGKKLTALEVSKYADIAIKSGKHKDAFDIYEVQEVSLPKDTAMIIAKSDIGDWLCRKVIAHLGAVDNPFTPEEFKELADYAFELGLHHEAFSLYEKTGDLVSPDEYQVKGEQLIGKVVSIESKRTDYGGDVWKTVSDAFSYLSKGNPKEAKLEMARFADSLVNAPEFGPTSNAGQIGEIYAMLDMPVPLTVALKAAGMAEKQQNYDLAAKFYVDAGMKHSASKMGHLALGCDNKGQRQFGAKDAFTAAGDKDGLALVEFIEKNLPRN